MLKSKNRTTGRKYNRGKYWIQQRDKCFARAGDRCEISGEPLKVVLQKIPTLPEEYGGGGWFWRRAVHHIVAERFCRMWFKGADPHCDGNLVVVTSALHAKLTAAERKLHNADIIGYKQELNRLGLDPALFDRAVTALCASVKT